MAAKDAPIRMQFVDDDITQVLEQLRPPRVVRQDAGVQHVGIGQHQMCPPSHRAPRVLRGVAVVGVGANRHMLFELGGEPEQLGQLILRQRLGREEIERARRVVLQDVAEHGPVVAKCLA